MSPAPSDWRERAAMASNEEAYRTPPDPSVGDCGVCGDQDQESKYLEDLDQWLCSNCDAGDLEQ